MERRAWDEGSVALSLRLSGSRVDHSTHPVFQGHIASSFSDDIPPSNPLGNAKAKCEPEYKLHSVD